MKPKKQTFIIALPQASLEVEGELLEIPFITIFIHRDPFCPKLWVVSELKAGLRLTYSINSKKEAIKNALEMVDTSKDGPADESRVERLLHRIKYAPQLNFKGDES